MGTSEILLLAISLISISVYFNNFLECVPNEFVADSLPAYRFWYVGLTTSAGLDCLDGDIVDLTKVSPVNVEVQKNGNAVVTIPNPSTGRSL